MIKCEFSNRVRSGIGIAGALFAAATLILVPTGCMLFSKGISAPQTNPDAPSFAEISARAGVAITSWYRVTTPKGWRFTRLDPRSNDGVVLSGHGKSDSSAGEIEYTIQRIAFDPAKYTGDFASPLEDYYAHRLDPLGANYEMANLTIEGRSYRYIVATDGREQMLSIPIVSDAEIILLTLIGGTGTFSLDATSARALAESFTIDRTGSEQRRGDALPAFMAVDHRWSWVRDVENGLVITGEISGMPCIVTVTAIPADEIPQDGRSVTSVFTGANVYQVIPRLTDPQQLDILLDSDTRSYRLVVDRISAENGEGSASWSADIATSDDFLTMTEHYLILDSAEAE